MTTRMMTILGGLCFAATLVWAEGATTRRAETGPASRAATGPAELPGEKLSPAEEKAIQPLLDKIRAASQKNDSDAILAQMPPAEAKLAKPLFEADKEYRKKVAILLQAAKAKGIALPAEAFESGSQQADWSLADDPSVQCRKIGKNRIVCFRESAKPLVFTKRDKQWLFSMELTDSSAKFQAELGQAFKKSVEEITTGINGGAITKENWMVKMNEVMQKRIIPVMQKSWAPAK